ncbi:hypothetical protein [Candidatus Atelocyanobacterium thalassae]|uniref:Uncharacterized protein n=1 Tax=cyanobacterium endosymbiont of Braarudosphaera bigelowii TaxID=1285375 RepID=A0ABM7U3D7_9CHRO|nr:hypothetical protein [Candidatus Atelocyanobacterium thalassa]BDA39210.1 hypothetical protein CPARK_000004900 [cyanobacterium endosymbiont of Braarudosphaera bigelowii]
MARYTCTFFVSTTLKEVSTLLDQILRSCNFYIIYEANDYLLAKENIDQVFFSKLVSIEIFIESTASKKNYIPINFIVKNDELPLNPNNHCYQRFQQIQTILNKNQKFHLAT